MRYVERVPTLYHAGQVETWSDDGAYDSFKYEYEADGSVVTYDHVEIPLQTVTVGRGQGHCPAVEAFLAARPGITVKIAAPSGPLLPVPDVPVPDVPVPVEPVPKPPAPVPTPTPVPVPAPTPPAPTPTPTPTPPIPTPPVPPKTRTGKKG